MLHWVLKGPRNSRIDLMEVWQAPWGGRDGASLGTVVTWTPEQEGGVPTC